MTTQIMPYKMESSYIEYINIAKKIVKKHASKFYLGLDRELLKNEFAIGDIATAIMIADTKWNPDYKGKNGKAKSKEGLRAYYAKFAIYRYLKEKYKNRTVSLDNFNLSSIIHQSNDENYNELQKIIQELLQSEEILTPKQSDFIKLYYLENKNQEVIAEKFGISKQSVSETINRGIHNIRAWLVKA